MNEYETEYNNLQFGKTDKIFEEMLKDTNGKLDNRFGQIDYLFSKKENDEHSDADAESEEIARYINTIVYNEEHRIYDEHIESFRQIEYGDVTILSRKKSNFPEIQSAFLKHSIPLIVNSGTGFYNSQEIMDFISFIRFLYDNTDDVSLAAILKADFFCN
jgi:ATP-dependent exoDNAse (exonuclease V) beta subunit